MKKHRRTTKLAIRSETLRKLDDKMLTSVAGGKTGPESVCQCGDSINNGHTCIPPGTDHC